MTHAVRLLLVEDVEDDALLLVRELRKGGIDPDYARVETAEELKAALENGPWDAVFADYNLPAFTGLDALRIVREKDEFLPFILVSGAIGEEKAVDALLAGAHDYIMKGQYARLVSAMERALRDAALQRERRQTTVELNLHREHLEELVRRRTGELAAANEALQAQSDELTGSLEKIRLVEKELRESEEQLHLMLDGVRDYAIFMLDPRGRVLTWNRGAECIKGYRAEEIIGKNVSCFYGREDLELGVPEGVLKTVEAEGRLEEERWRVRRDGSRFLADVLITALYDHDGKLRGFSEVTRDITERKLTEETLKSTLADKDVLMRELAHRTKNNMQVISSMISLQAIASADPTLSAALADTQGRIRAMALVHEKIYRSPTLSHVNMREYLTDLVKALRCAYAATNGPVSLSLDVDELPVSIDTAMPCGLIINELVSNSLKYAFPRNKPGGIFLSFRRLGEEAELRYRDDGPGLPIDVDPSRTKSLGLKLVHNIATRQLHGKMELRRDPVTEFVFRFGCFPHLEKV